MRMPLASKNLVTSSTWSAETIDGTSFALACLYSSYLTPLDGSSSGALSAPASAPTSDWAASDLGPDSPPPIAFRPRQLW